MALDQKMIDAIRTAVDEGEEGTIEFLQEILRAPSVNPWFGDPAEVSGEEKVQDIFEARMRAVGAVDIDRWEPNAEALSHRGDGPGYYPGRDFTGRPNVVGRLAGSDPSRPAMMIQGHCDVVSAADNWTKDPFGGERENGRIYGRGAVDMKGGMAAAFGAVEALQRAGVTLQADLILASVADEEAGGMGTLALVDRGYTAPAGVIVPESTELSVAPLCRGILWGEVVLTGRAGHIELTQASWEDGGAVDSIKYAHKLMDAIAARNELWKVDPLKNHRFADAPCEIKIAQIQAGNYPTTYADKTVITFNAQYLPVQKDANGLGSIVKAELEELFHNFLPGDGWLAEHPVQVNWLVDADCGETDADDPIVQDAVWALEVAGLEPKIAATMSHTDMGLMVDSGSPTINFGPGMGGLAHHSDEYCNETELKAATLVMALTIASRCGATLG